MKNNQNQNNRHLNYQVVFLECPTSDVARGTYGFLANGASQLAVQIGN